jgi:hypothetical protein
VVEDQARGKPMDDAPPRQMRSSPDMVFEEFAESPRFEIVANGPKIRVRIRDDEPPRPSRE